jgi:putative PIN family toxin of toxin-antitoxin system
VRVVLDTNVFVSRYLNLTGTPARILDYWRRNAFELLVSPAILAEYERIMRHERIVARHGLSGEQVASSIAALRRSATVVQPTQALEGVTSDPDDDKFVACAVAGGADFIVSGDSDLLRIDGYAGIRIITPRAFITLIESGQM